MSATCILYMTCNKEIYLFLGFSKNWWVGLSILHNLFTREHNLICDMLLRYHPEWADDDERLFQTSRYEFAMHVNIGSFLSNKIRPYQNRHDDVIWLGASYLGFQSMMSEERQN